MEKHHKILVVDDDPDFLESMALMLAGDSYQVVLAPNPDDALAAIEADRPDLLILDVMMDEWNSGFLFLWKLRRDDRYKDIPILMVTSVDKELNIDFASHATNVFKTAAEQEYLPVDGYLVKPVKTGALLGKVRALLRRGVSRLRAVA